MTEAIIKTIEQMRDEYVKKHEEAGDVYERNYDQGAIDALSDLLEILQLS